MIAALFVALSLVNAAPATKTVTSKDNGKTITISKQQGLHIDLDECGSCGYSWRTTTKPNPKVLTRRPSTTKDPDCPPPDPANPPASAVATPGCSATSASRPAARRSGSSTSGPARRSPQTPSGSPSACADQTAGSSNSAVVSSGG